MSFEHSESYLPFSLVFEATFVEKLPRGVGSTLILVADSETQGVWLVNIQSCDANFDGGSGGIIFCEKLIIH